MSFKPYISDQHSWTSYFSKSKGSTTKHFYNLKSEKAPPSSNTEPMKLISPTAQGIQQAKMDLKRQYEELLEDNPELNTINTPAKKRKVQSTVRKRKDNK